MVLVCLVFVESLGNIGWLGPEFFGLIGTIHTHWGRIMWYKVVFLYGMLSMVEFTKLVQHVYMSRS
jgi:hypothetical protein